MSQSLFLVTKVKILGNKVLKTICPQRTLVTQNNQRYPNLIPLFCNNLLFKFINSLIINVWILSSEYQVTNIII